MTPAQRTQRNLKPQHLRRWGFAASSCAFLLLAAPSTAQGEIKVTAQAQAAHAEWLPYAPPPQAPAAVCIVDSGVNLNADTQPVVTRRVALDGGTLDDVDATEHHGTLMAMTAAAAVNNTGMIGAAPQVRIVSVRSADQPTATGLVTSSFIAYSTGIETCRKYARSDGVSVVELALARSGSPTPEESAALVDQVTLAHTSGLNVVAAAGNDGGPLNEPASTPGIVAVGAADRAGVFCGFSSRGDGLRALAPGCELDTADPVTLSPMPSQGTSQASAFFAAVLAALRSYRPELAWSDAEQLLTSTAPNGVLNVEAAFRAAGLGPIVDAGIAATPSNLATTGTPATTITTTRLPMIAPERPRVTTWHRPTATVRYRNGVLSVITRGAPKAAFLKVTLQRRLATGYVRSAGRTTRERSARLRSTTRPHRVAIMYRDPTGRGRDSPTLYVSKYLR